MSAKMLDLRFTVCTQIPLKNIVYLCQIQIYGFALVSLE